MLTPQLMAQVVYLCVLATAAVVANSMVIITIVIGRIQNRISKKFILYIINLAICDFFVGAFLIPVYIAIILGKYHVDS